MVGTSCLVYILTDATIRCEQEFLAGWVRYIFLESLVLGWHRALRNAILAQLVLLYGFVTSRFNPFLWFGTLDCALSALRPPSALRPTPYALRPTPYALRPTPYALRHMP